MHAEGDLLDEFLASTKRLNQYTIGNIALLSAAITDGEPLDGGETAENFASEIDRVTDGLQRLDGALPLIAAAYNEEERGHFKVALVVWDDYLTLLRRYYVEILGNPDGKVFVVNKDNYQDFVAAMAAKVGRIPGEEQDDNGL